MSLSRWTRHRPHRLALVSAAIVAVIAGTVAAGCVSHGVATPGAFARADRIGTELQRGVSTKADVERLLGKPNGRGMTLLPTQDSVRELWTYVHVETGAPKLEGRVFGVPTVRMDSRQQDIYVFFDGDRFDGYMWATRVGAATRTPQ